MQETRLADAFTVDDELWDLLDAHDVFHLDSSPNEPEIGSDLRSAFENVGYSVTRVELARTHPVVVVHATCKGAVPMSDRSLLQSFRFLLRQVGLRLRGDELIISQRGKRVMVALLWKDSPVDPRPTGEELEAQYDPIP